MQWFQATQIPVAIRGACRINRTDYCTVGDHGMILITRDQGKTWVTTRGKERRTSVLFVTNNARTTAWSMLGSEALESRNRVSLLVRETLTTPIAGSPNHALANHALANQVAIMLGGSGADAIGQWGADLNQTALAWLGIHQPKVLVLDETLPTAFREAFLNAAASTGIQRIAVYGFSGNGGTSLHRDALLSHCGTLAGDLHVDAMHYLSPNDIQINSTTLRYPYDISPNQRRGSSVTNGLALPPGHRLAGKGNDASRHQLQILKGQDFNKLIDFISLVKNQRTTQLFSTNRSNVCWIKPQKQINSEWHGRSCKQHALEKLSMMALPCMKRHSSNLRHDSLILLRETGPRCVQQSILQSAEWQLIRSGLIKPYGNPKHKPASSSAVPVSPVPSYGWKRIRQVSNTSPLVVPKAGTIPNHKVAQSIVENEANVDLLWEFHPRGFIR